MTAKQPTATQVLAFSAVALLIIPVLVFIASGLIRGMDPLAIIPAIGEQYLAEKNNLFVVSILVSRTVRTHVSLPLCAIAICRLFSVR